MKIHPLGAAFCADGQADMMKLIDDFCSFVNTPKNGGNVHGKHFSVNLPVGMSCNEQSVHVRVFVVWFSSHSGLQSFRNYQKANV